MLTPRPHLPGSHQSSTFRRSAADRCNCALSPNLASASTSLSPTWSASPLHEPARAAAQYTDLMATFSNSCSRRASARGSERRCLARRPIPSTTAEHSRQYIAGRDSKPLTCIEGIASEQQMWQSPMVGDRTLRAVQREPATPDVERTGDLGSRGAPHHESIVGRVARYQPTLRSRTNEPKRAPPSVVPTDATAPPGASPMA